MMKKFPSPLALMALSASFAMFLGLSACSDDSSSVNVHIDSGDEINIDVPTGDAPGDSKVTSSSDEDISSSSNPKSSSSKIDTLRVEAYDSEESGSSADAESSSSVVSDDNSSSSASKEKSSSSETSAKEDTGFINEGWRDDCLAKINEYRATESLSPLSLAAEEKQTCTEEAAAADLAENSPHGHFGDCGEFAQNSGPNFNTSWQKNASAVAEYYLKMMWEEEKALVTSGERDPEKKEDYPSIGHYLNMKNTSYTKVACGIALSADGKKGWFNVNFY
ncbi:MAG: hypothetical protein IKO21_02360 [Fibrobacter sp.]|nr:hypothetical protein [Fibrobacter sp.]